VSSEVSQYAYLNGRVSVLAESLLPEARLRGLLQVGNEASVLRDAALPEELHEERDPAVLEQRLMSVLMHEAALLIRPLSGLDRELLRYWMGRVHLINLKLLLRGIVTHAEREALASHLLDLRPLDFLPTQALLHSEDVAEFLRNLEQSPFSEMARYARTVYSERQSQFDLESALDHHYFTGLVKRINAVGERDRLRMRMVIGLYLDQINLVWLLRYRLIYRITPPHAYFLLIPAGHHLHSKQLLALAQLESLDAVVAALPDALRERLAGVENITQVELRMEALSTHAANRLLRATSFNVSRAMFYLLLRQRQLMHIHAILKGRALGLAEELIRASASLEEAV